MTLAVYIPLVPYIIWIAVILAWVIAVVEAVIAAPLWMLSHVSGEGEGIATGAGEAGYKFVAAVFLRPTLSVISFFVASLVVMAMADVINTSFMEMVKKVQSDSMTGMFTLVGFIGVYTGLCSMLINKSFGLTLTLPSSILSGLAAACRTTMATTAKPRTPSTRLVLLLSLPVAVLRQRG